MHKPRAHSATAARERARRVALATRTQDTTVGELPRRHFYPEPGRGRASRRSEPPPRHHRALAPQQPHAFLGRQPTRKAHTYTGPRHRYIHEGHAAHRRQSEAKGTQPIRAKVKPRAHSPSLRASRHARSAPQRRHSLSSSAAAASPPAAKATSARAGLPAPPSLLAEAARGRRHFCR